MRTKIYASYGTVRLATQGLILKVWQDYPMLDMRNFNVL